MIRELLITVHAKPNTCGNCRHAVPVPRFDARDVRGRLWCRVFDVELRKERHHIYRCQECKEAER